jgi:hypothetical protein
MQGGRTADTVTRLAAAFVLALVAGPAWSDDPATWPPISEIVPRGLFTNDNGPSTFAYLSCADGPNVAIRINGRAACVKITKHFDTYADCFNAAIVARDEDGSPLFAAGCWLDSNIKPKDHP